MIAPVGLQLPSVPDGLSGRSAGDLVLHAVVVALTVMAIRFLWVHPATWLQRRLSRTIRERDATPPWSSATVLAFTGMRGAVSLAAALRCPRASPAVTSSSLCAPRRSSGPSASRA